jgi:hypothetical protein
MTESQLQFWLRMVLFDIESNLSYYEEMFSINP